MKVTSEQLLDLFGLKVGDVVRVIGETSFTVVNEKFDHGNSFEQHSLYNDYGYYNSLIYLFDKEYEIIKQIPKLTEDEKVILRNIGIYFKWIARDCNNMLCWFYVKPTRTHKTDDWWGVKENDAGTYMFGDLFDFITKNDEEPYNIKELLDE